MVKLGNPRLQRHLAKDLRFNISGKIYQGKVRKIGPTWSVVMTESLRL